MNQTEKRGSAQPKTEYYYGNWFSELNVVEILPIDYHIFDVIFCAKIFSIEDIANVTPSKKTSNDVKTGRALQSVVLITIWWLLKRNSRLFILFLFDYFFLSFSLFRLFIRLRIFDKISREYKLLKLYMFELNGITHRRQISQKGSLASIKVIILLHRNRNRNSERRLKEETNFTIVYSICERRERWMIVHWFDCVGISYSHMSWNCRIVWDAVWMYVRMYFFFRLCARIILCGMLFFYFNILWMMWAIKLCLLSMIKRLTWIINNSIHR